jgi:transcriptional regulator with XRE-family HTH domain
MKKEKKEIVTRLRERIKPENRIYIRKNLAISNQVEILLKQKGLTQKELAKILGKNESEVSKWLSGLHNLTLQSIAKMEAALESDIILTPSEAFDRYTHIEYVTLKVYAKSNLSEVPEQFDYSETFELIPEENQPLAS